MAQSILESILSTLPQELSTSVRDLCASEQTKATVENLLRFTLGAECAASPAPLDWFERQARARIILEGIVSPSSNKRVRDDGASNDRDSPGAGKRPKLQADGVDASASSPVLDLGKPLFILHSVSTTSPVRKKVDLKIFTAAISLVNLTTGTVEAEIPLKHLTRAFLLPTRGKTKPHWTIVLLSADSPSTTKSASNDPSNQQVIFGIDAKSTAPVSTTTFTPGESKETHSKGTETLPILRQFLSHLPFPVLEPSVQVFRSSVGGPGPSGNGVPGIEAYRGAKAGSLWFMKEGILWGESKPCEFWSVEDLINRTEGLRIVGGTGKTCSVLLTRRPQQKADQEGDEPADTEGEETQFGVIDAKEQDPMNDWIRNHRHLFGSVNGQAPPPATKSQQKPLPSGNITLANAQFDDDEDSDSSFNDEESDDSGGSGSDSGSDDEEAEGHPSGAPSDAVGDDEEDVAMESEEELDPAKHPLLRQGALPKMSRAAMDMAVKMVTDDLMGEPEGEEDELDDD
ncbi:hypothetical protein ONZ45_g5754 [Pleurotus djamor]|nr:hypothetical protein ONZ45_g5754 [Pleurotus djamor]